MFIVAYARRVGCEAGHERVEAGPFASARIGGDGLAAAEHAVAEGVTRFGGMDDGFPGWMDRVRACGNSIVPAHAEWIGRRVMEMA